MTDSRHLPGPGGIEDQDETLMIDLATLNYVSSLVRAQVKADKENANF